MSELAIALVDAFTQTRGEGNRAGVVIHATELSEHEMQSIGFAVGVSETAFVVSDLSNPVLKLRYFTPKVEIAFCGHATVATFHYLAERGLIDYNKSYAFNTPAGDFEAWVERMPNKSARIWFPTPQPAFEDSPISYDEIFASLGGSFRIAHNRLPIRRSAHRLYVPVASLTDLWGLSPDFDAIKQWSDAYGIRGVYVFTTETSDPESITQGRCFCPASGVNEDPVTGSASGPLGSYLVAHGILILPTTPGTIRTRLEQGDAIGKPGRVDLEITGSYTDVTQVRIGGTAVTVLRGTMP